MTPPELPFTGERFTPECLREIWYEHWHRYAFAEPLARGRRVLDAACGEGYGAALLSRVAAQVTGVDIAPDAIEHARARYGEGRPNLRFECADAAALPFDDAAFDLVVSFETLEHLAAQEALVAGFARVLAEDGMLVISSPDRHAYSEARGFRNEFHVRELYRPEFEALLAPHFPHVRLYGQKLLFQSVLWALDGNGGHVAATTARQGGDVLETGLQYAPLYFIAVASRRALPASLPGLGLFGDAEETVYSHYNGEVQRNMAAGARIAELEAEVGRLRSEARPVPSRRPWWRRKQ